MFVNFGVVVLGRLFAGKFVITRLAEMETACVL
jgi:hypothetical protein